MRHVNILLLIFATVTIILFILIIITIMAIMVIMVRGSKGSLQSLQGSKEEIGPPWRGLCTGQLLTSEVSIQKLENGMRSNQQSLLFRLVTKFQPSSATPLSSCQSFQAIRFKIVPLLVLLYFSLNNVFEVLRLVRKVIMIAAGSGIAPFRSFWQERQRQAQVGHGTSPQYQNRYLDLVV